MSEDNGNKIPEENKDHLGVINIDGKDVKVIDCVTMIEVRVVKLENGKEFSQLIADEKMMINHKPYMTRLLTDAILAVAKAGLRKKQGPIKTISEGGLKNLLGRLKNRKNGAFGRLN